MDDISPLEIPANKLSELRSTQLILEYQFSQNYSANGLESLIDKTRGSNSYTDKKWLGFEKQNFELLIDLGESKSTDTIKIGFLEDQNAWIFFPKSIEVYSSDDNVNFVLEAKKEIDSPKESSKVMTENVELPLQDVKARYIKIIAENIGQCPSWHKGSGGDAWLFVDEIFLK